MSTANNQTQPAAMGRWRSRWFLPVVVIVGLLGGVIFLVAKARSVNANMLVDMQGVPWVVSGSIKSARSMEVLPTEAVFRRGFEFQGSPGDAVVLALCAAGLWEAKVERVMPGQAASQVVSHFKAEADRPWNLPTAVKVELPGPGEYVLKVLVRRHYGPAALWCRLVDTGNGSPVFTGPQWEYSINGSAWAQARPADSPWIGDETDPWGSAHEAVWGRPWAVSVLVVTAVVLAAAGLVLLRTGKFRSVSRAHYWIIALIGVVSWCLLLILAWLHLPLTIGFDSLGHLQYIERVRTGGGIGMASDGWQMYQPPGYYLLAGGWLALWDVPTFTERGVMLVRCLNLALVACYLLLAARAIELFLGTRSGVGLLALLLLIACPVGFYVFAYITNENLHAVACMLVLMLLAGFKGKTAEGWPGTIGLGLALALALLSKASALVLLAPVFAFYGMRILALRSARGWQSALPVAIRLSAVLLVAACASGWYYGMVWRAYGTPLVGNWMADQGAGMNLWMPPMYRTASDYLPGLAAFASPLLAGFHDVWSGLWSTWAGDAAIGGAAQIDGRPGWNDWVLPVSLVTSLLLFLCCVVGLGAGLKPGTGRYSRRSLLLFVAICSGLFLLLYMTLTIPYAAAYAQAKSFYAPMLALPVCALAAVGLVRLARRRRVPFAATFLIAGPWLLVFFAMFFMTASNQTQWLKAQREITRGPAGHQQAIALLLRLVESRPDHYPARIELARLLVTGNDGDTRKVDFASQLIDLPESAADPHARSLPSDQPWQAQRLAVESLVLQRRGETAKALASIDRAIELRPDRLWYYTQKNELLKQSGQLDEARKCARQGLVYFPWSTELHASAFGPE